MNSQYLWNMNRDSGKQAISLAKVGKTSLYMKCIMVLHAVFILRGWDEIWKNVEGKWFSLKTYIHWNWSHSVIQDVGPILKIYGVTDTMLYKR